MSGNNEKPTKIIRTSIMKKLMFIAAMVFIGSIPLLAQDAEGCKDHPVLSRMPGYNISECTQNFNQLDFVNTKGEDVKLEGNLTHIWYVFNPESGKKEPSFFQIVKNYANAIVKIGGKKILEDGGLGCLNCKKMEKPIT
jgi:OOP family OmpA-OmpF porin